MSELWEGPISTTDADLRAAAELLGGSVHTWGNSHVELRYTIGAIKYTLTGRAFSTGADGRTYYAHPDKLPVYNRPVTDTTYKMSDLAMAGPGSRTNSQTPEGFRGQTLALIALLSKKQ